LGHFGNAFAEYVQPLIDQCDGSEEQIKTAFMLGQVCWNLALSPADIREEMYCDMQRTFKLDNVKFEELLDSTIFPMIRRHVEMFPHMHHPDSSDGLEGLSEWAEDVPEHVQEGKSKETSPNAPCPCGSGKKYKRCCGRMC